MAILNFLNSWVCSQVLAELDDTPDMLPIETPITSMHLAVVSYSKNRVYHVGCSCCVEGARKHARHNASRIHKIGKIVRIRPAHRDIDPEYLEAISA